MATRTLSAFDIKANWPTKWGASGKLVITHTRSVVSEDGVSYPATSKDGGPLNTVGFHWEAAITVVSGVGTTTPLSGLINTDTATPDHVDTYNIYVYDSKGKLREKLNAKPYHIHESLNGGAPTFTWEQWVAAMEFVQFRGDNVFIGDRVTVQSMVDAAANSKAGVAPTYGITALSVAPASAADPVAVGTNDSRVTADQAANVASIRTLGTGAQQAAAGNDPRLMLNVKSQGAKGDVVDVQTGGVNVGAPNTITGAVGLTSANVGNVFVLQGAGVAGAPLRGVINAILSSTSFTSSVAASTAVSNKEMYYGTDDTAAFAAALAALAALGYGGELTVPQSGDGYIANLQITSGVSLRGLGTFRPRRINAGSTLSFWDEVSGVVIRTANSSDVLTVTDAQGVTVSNIVFDGARLSPWVATLDRIRFSNFYYLGAVRGATGGVRIGASATVSGAADDGCYHNNFYDLYISSSPTGISFTKWGSGIAGAFVTRIYGLNIEYDGTGADDCGIAFRNGDTNYIYGAFIQDQFNVSPKPGVRWWPFVDANSAYLNIIYGLEAARGGVKVDDGNLFAGAVWEYNQANGAPDPVIGTGSALAFSRIGGNAGAGTVGERHYAFNAPFEILSGSTTAPSWTALALGRIVVEAAFSISDFDNRFLLGDRAGDAVFRLNDATKKMLFGTTGASTPPTFGIDHNSIVQYTNNGGVFQQNKDGDPASNASAAWATGFNVPGGAVGSDRVVSYYNGSAWAEKFRYLTAGSMFVKTAGEGIILTSPNGLVAKKLTIDNAGAIVLTNYP